MKARQQSLFEDQRLMLRDSIALTIESLVEYGRRYRHWVTAYSGGKDSSAVVTLIAYLLVTGQIDPPESWTILYADTRQELPPLQAAATALLAALEKQGIETKVVLPALDERFYVYMLGRGVPPPKNKFRWCTSQLKIYPMMRELEERAVALGFGEMVPADNRRGEKYQGFGQEKLLMMTGVRLGESAARDQRIVAACNKDSGECGTGLLHIKNARKEDKDTPGMFVRSPDDGITDTLAPALHWRLCHIYDWLYFETTKHGFKEVVAIAHVYGEEDVRTGCIGCNLVNKDTSLLRLLKYHPTEWGHLEPLLELKPLFRELKKAKHRLRKGDLEYRQDGTPVKNPQRLGPLTMEARAWALNVVLDIQRRVNEAANGRPGVDLINAEEEARIRELWALNTWPNRWEGDEVTGDVPLDSIMVTAAGDVITQPLLVK